MDSLATEVRHLPNFDQVLSNLGISGGDDSWRQDWHLSQDSYHPGNLPFLKEGEVRARCRFLRMSVEVEQAFLDALPMFKALPPLERLLWHCHYLLFVAKKSSCEEIETWPCIPRAISDTADMFYAFLFLSGLPVLRDFYKTKGIPESILINTLADLELWMSEYKTKNGVWGLGEKGWLSVHFTGTLFALGRLQFRMAEFPLDFHVFRNKDHRQILILAGNGMRFRPDGLFADTDGVESPKSWSAPYSEEDNGAIRGVEIFPEAKAAPRVMDFNLNTWVPVLKKGDPILEIHIPAASPLLAPACEDSLKQSRAFFAQYFPDFPWKAYTCVSWMLNPHFADVLPPDSNIVCFQRKFRLFPVPGADDKQMFDRVFDGAPRDIANLPRNTTLRRAILEHMEQNGRWHLTGGVLIP